MTGKQVSANSPQKKGEVIKNTITGDRIEA